MSVQTFLDLPMFFEPAHVELGGALAASFRAADPELHTAGRVIPRLASLGLLELIVPGAAGRVTPAAPLEVSNNTPNISNC